MKKRHMSNEEKEERIVDIACSLGKLILKNGGETYRVEETIKRTLVHYGMNGNSFATLDTVITSIDFAGRKYSKVERIEARNINLDKVDKLNDIARNLGKYSLEEVKEKIDEIDKEEHMTFFKKIFGNILVGGAFAILFKGNFKDSLVAILSTFVLACVDRLTIHLHLNVFFINFIGGAISTIISLLFFKVGYIEDISISIISALMLLVPGISFTNSIRDIIAGDFISGLSRGIEAVTTGIALAAGSGVILSIFL